MRIHIREPGAFLTLCEVCHMNFYNRFPGDYRRDTGDLSLTEHGAYSLLLDHCYSTEQPLPKNHNKLYRICGATLPEEQAAVRSVAERFFPINGTGDRHNKRVDKQLQMELARIAAARAGGVTSAAKMSKEERKSRALMGARAKWNAYAKAERKQKYAYDMLTTCLPDAYSPTPTPTPTPDPFPDPYGSVKQGYKGNGVRGGWGKGRPAPPQAGPPDVVLPDSVDSGAWEDYSQYRIGIGGKSKRSWSMIAKRKAIKFLSQHSPSEQREIVDRSIMNGWQGIFELEKGVGPRPVDNSGAAKRAVEILRAQRQTIAGTCEEVTK